MSIKKLDDGRFEVDIRPQGTSGRRVRRRFSKKTEAQAFEKYVLVNYHDKDWLEKPDDKRCLSQLVELWWSYSGRGLAQGENYRKRLERITKQLGDPRAYMLSRKFLSEYRSKRIQSGIKTSTVNRDLALISSVFRTLIEVDEFHGDNPIHNLKKLRLQNNEMAFLEDDEIGTLLESLEGDERRVAVLCLNTGARWGEASKLKAEHIINNRVTFIETKTGPRRTVPISQEVTDYVLTRKSGRLFNADYARAREILKAVKPNLPKGQALHVLRHTFATHFMSNGGNIITLQRILGHKSIEQTMVYAHFAPDYLTDAIRYNPLKGSSTYCPPVRAF